MNIEKLNNLFNKIKAEANLDYAIINTDDYGDCNTCVNDALCDKYGAKSKGVFVKHWMRGINAGDTLENLDFIFIAHDISAEQDQKIIELSKAEGYGIEPEEYKPSECFKIWEKIKEALPKKDST